MGLINVDTRTIQYISFEKATKRALGTEGTATDRHIVKDGSCPKEVPAPPAAEADTSTDLPVGLARLETREALPSRCKGPSWRSRVSGEQTRNAHWEFSMQQSLRAEGKVAAGGSSLWTGVLAIQQVQASCTWRHC